MVSIFDIIPNNFFNPLSSNSNYRTNAALLQFIYEQCDNEISYRIKRNILRDEVEYYISEHSEEVVDPFYSQENMIRLKELVAQMEATGDTVHEVDFDD